MRLDGKAGGILVEMDGASLVLVPLAGTLGTDEHGHPRYAVIDHADYPKVMHRRWRAARGRTTQGYKAASGKQGVLLHRELLGLPVGGRHIQVDHANGNTLDNRRANIRVATPQENGWNRPLRSDNKSGFKGVRLEYGRWRARIRDRESRLLMLGVYESPEMAARAYDEAARRLHGEFARVNFA